MSMKVSKQDLLFCEQKRSKKNFDSRGIWHRTGHTVGNKVFFASFLRPDDEAALAAQSESGRLFGSKKKTLPSVRGNCHS
jgi:hypothetical protein